MLPNNSKQNDLFNNIKIPLSATEDEEINNISSNPEINYNDKEKKPTRNIHLIYKKSDNKKIYQKRNMPIHLTRILVCLKKLVKMTLIGL